MQAKVGDRVIVYDHDPATVLRAAKPDRKGPRWTVKFEQPEPWRRTDTVTVHGYSMRPAGGGSS